MGTDAAAQQPLVELGVGKFVAPQRPHRRGSRGNVHPNATMNAAPSPSCLTAGS